MSSPIRCSMAKCIKRMAEIVEEHYSPPGMTAPLAAKDLRLALAEAEHASVPMPVTPAQPHSGVVVERPVRFGDGAYIEVVRPAAQRAVQLVHQLCGVLPSSQ